MSPHGTISPPRQIKLHMSLLCALVSSHASLIRSTAECMAQMQAWQAMPQGKVLEVLGI